MQRLAELRSVQLSDLTDEKVNTPLQQTASFLDESMRLHGLVLGIALANAMLVLICRDLFGWDDQQTISFLSAFVPVTNITNITTISHQNWSSSPVRSPLTICFSWGVNRRMVRMSRVVIRYRVSVSAA